MLEAHDPLDLAKDLAREISARAQDADTSGSLPEEDVQALKTSGLLSLSIPEAYGGASASLKTCVDVGLELAKASASTALVFAMTVHITGAERSAKAWHEEARETLFRKVAAGALLNSAASEPRLGSPSRGGLPDTYAKEEDDTLVLNGHKNWVTGGPHLDHLLVRLRLEDEAVIIWVPADTKGLRWEATWGDGLSLRASDSHDLFLEKVHVPKDKLIQRGRSPTNVWFPMMMAATYFGVALAARNEVIRYALERSPTALGKPIATLPNIQRQIGDLDTKLQAAQALLLEVAAAYEETGDANAFMPRVAAAKHIAVETALAVTDQCLRVAGAAGIDRGLGLERYFRDVRAGLMHPPSGDAALELIGRSALGL